MKTLSRFFISTAIAVLPLQLFATTTLDQWLTPNELAQELNLEQKQTIAPLRNPLTPEQVQAQYGVDIFAEFPVVIIINTANAGPTAQTVTVHHLGQVVGTFATSTGRGKWETPPSGGRYYTNTPVGWYQPHAYVKDHHSSIWDASMEYSIFFNAGIAIHATTPDLYEKLGTRASGGCVRLTRENAITVWDLSVNLPRKLVPMFEVDGRIKTDSNGQVLRQEGNATLIIVTNKRS